MSEIFTHITSGSDCVNRCAASPVITNDPKSHYPDHIYELHFDVNAWEVLMIDVDDCVYSGWFSIIKCDKAILCTPNEVINSPPKKIAVFVEFKGSNILQAIRQIASTIERNESEAIKQGFLIRARVVHRDSIHILSMRHILTSGEYRSARAKYGLVLAEVRLTEALPLA
jgi:hypothetical protein